MAASYRHCTATPFLRWETRLLSLLLWVDFGVADFVSYPRWGQATALVNDRLFVHGGKTDQYNSFSYTGAPTSNDLLLLDLSQAFDPSNPPWQYTSGSADSSSNVVDGPTLAWHTLSAYSTTQLLLFGGDGGPNSPIVLPSQADSAGLLNVSNIQNTTWHSEPESWASEPSRRIHHSTASSGGRVYLIGGEKDDGSGIGYSEHYVFDPNGPSFTLLPAANAPPDITGHASVMLSNGQLLVFGGFSQSQSQLVPLTTIWSLDTMQPTPAWSTVQVSDGVVPPPRRAFASTWLGGDKILIHGGSDAQLSTSFSDGWVLDTTTNPMTWSNISTLAEIGPRRDHFAVQVGSQVLFGFGYAANGGAPVALSVFDFSQSAFATSFTPQSSPSQITLPAPSGTGGTSPGGSHGSHPSTGGSQPTNSNYSNGSDSSSDEHKKDSTVAIALGSVFGMLGLAAAIVVLTIHHRRRSQSQQEFRLISDNELDSPSAFFSRNGGQALGVSGIIPWIGTVKGEKVRMADRERAWTFLGLGRRKPEPLTQKHRIDMLANEDSELGNFGVRRMGSGSSKSWYSIRNGGPSAFHGRFASEGSGRPSLGQWFSGSLSSLRNMGAMLGTTVSMGIRRVGTDGSGSRHRRETTADSLPLDPFGDNADNEGLLHLEGHNPYAYDPAVILAARPRGGRQETSVTSRYSDPFKDQEERDVLFNASTHLIDMVQNVERTPDVVHTDLAYDPSLSQSTLSRSSVAPQLPPLLMLASNGGSDTAPSSLITSDSQSGQASSTSLHSNDAVGAPSSSYIARPRTSSIIGASGTPTQPVKRSNSWWGRLKRTSFRESVYEPASAKIELDFRDPNPPPGRLDAIREGSGSREASATTPESDRERRAKASMYSTSGGHERSTTSLKTSRTADSETIERMAGRVDVAQREGTGTSTDYSPSIIGDSERRNTYSSLGELPSSSVASPDRSRVIIDSDVVHYDEPQELVESPTEEPAFLYPPHPESGSQSGSSSGAHTPTSPIHSAEGKRPTPTGAVASRVADYERRMTEEASPTSPISLDVRVGPKPKRKSAAVKYGLVQRPPLFVANPDHRTSTSSDS